MTASIKAVAATCVSAPRTTQGQKAGGGRGRPCPSAIITPARKMSANGNPNRKRTWVAPTVPSLVVSSRCAALRTVCAAAATMVKTAQSHEGSNMPQPSRRSTLWDRTSVAALGPLGDRTLLVIHDHEQVEVADDRFGPRALLHAFAPGRVVALPCGFPRRPDVSAAAIAVFAQQVVLAHQIRIGAPMRDRVPGIFQYGGTIHAGRRLEQY